MVELTNEQLLELQKTELNILREFIEVCNKLDLRYYVMEGTLLGAVRHGGFIPWDDDIDVGLPRKDYEIFLEKGAELLSPDLFIQSRKTDPEFPSPFAKIRNSKTTYVETLMDHLNIHHGVFIDVYALDYFPEDKLQKTWFNIRKVFFQKRISAHIRRDEEQNFRRNLTDAIIKLIFPNAEKVFEKREHMMKSIPPSNLMCYYSGRAVVPESWYGEGTELSFEGMTVIAPREYDRWLTMAYGDYMKLPPPDEQIGHHYVSCFDLKRSYIEYRHSCG